jgi:hypothetical protein
MFFLQLIGLLILVHFFEKFYTLLGVVDKRNKVITLEENLDPPNNTKAKMLAIFNKKLVNPPQELNSPAPLNSSRKSKLPDEILHDFTSSNPSNAFSMNFGNDAFLAYSPSNNSSKHQGYVTIILNHIGSQISQLNLGLYILFLFWCFLVLINKYITFFFVFINFYKICSYWN